VSETTVFLLRGFAVVIIVLFFLFALAVGIGNFFISFAEMRGDFDEKPSPQKAKDSPS
jgi:Na+-transporting methylmalonyl-CoA/oxaloacetate decarboxylase gamma subunit